MAVPKTKHKTTQPSSRVKKTARPNQAPKAAPKAAAKPSVKASPPSTTEKSAPQPAALSPDEAQLENDFKTCYQLMIENAHLENSDMREKLITLETNVNAHLSVLAGQPQKANDPFWQKYPGLRYEITPANLDDGPEAKPSIKVLSYPSAQVLHQAFAPKDESFRGKSITLTAPTTLKDLVLSYYRFKGGANKISEEQFLQDFISQNLSALPSHVEASQFQQQLQASKNKDLFALPIMQETLLPNTKIRLPYSNQYPESLINPFFTPLP